MNIENHRVSIEKHRKSYACLEMTKEIMRLKRELRDTQDALEVLKKAISILGD